jgi:hypothetical protein
MMMESDFIYPRTCRFCKHCNNINNEYFTCGLENQKGFGIDPKHLESNCNSKPLWCKVLDKLLIESTDENYQINEINKIFNVDVMDKEPIFKLKEN